ncbi:SMI1/KNR4 family protein [Spirillospora sp. NPDC029432]|uniref:SMI1/KNR4 family protein n=1 Tax=Spirillospora sp. NPDC029432 TaxID=3154599 RepID=UPI003454F539
MDELVALVPPPEDPDLGTKSWDTVFDELGSPLPADFMALVEQYGSFEIGGYAFDGRGENTRGLEYLGVMDPRYAGGNWAKGAVNIGDVYRELREEHPASFPPAAWPEPGGFLSWGNTIDADHFGWLTVGHPDDWPIVLWGRGHEWDDQEPLQTTVTEFLVNWLSGSPDLPHMPELWPGGSSGPVWCDALPLEH